MKKEASARPALEVAREFQAAKRRICQELAKVKATRPVDTAYYLAGQRVDLEAWELRLLMKVYRPVRGLVRWVKRIVNKGGG